MSKSSISLSSIDSRLLNSISKKNFNLDDSKSSNSDSIKYTSSIPTNQINESILEIKELNLELINPNSKNYNIESQGGSKLVIIGKPGTGKSTLIDAILYEKKDIIPVGKFVSGTEDSNNFYKEIAPSLFISNVYEEEDVEKFIKRQKLAKKHIKNPWAVLLLDDCTDKPALFKRPLQQNLYKNGRHYKMLYIVSLQYCMDVLPSIRTNVDGVFILRETNLKNRHSLYENYAGIIPDFNIFCQIMDQITNDYTALYIHNSTTTNDWRDCIFWYKADMSKIKNWKFGCPDYWKFAKNRFDPNYTDTI